MYFFDLDGTLIDSNGIWAQVDRTFLARRGLPYTKEYYDGVAHTIFPIAAEFTKKYAHLSESCEEIMAEWMALAKDNYAHVALKADVREFLDKCRGEGKRMAILTSSVPEHCKMALECHGLAPYFERVIFAQELGMDKSSPAIFCKAAELVSTAVEECTLFDDSVKSCQSARSAGMYVVGVYDAFFEATKAEMAQCCDRFIHGFSELL